GGGIARRLGRSGGRDLSRRARSYQPKAGGSKVSMKFWLALGFAVPLFAGDPRLFYSKSFPGSMPPYVQITLEKTGDVEYRDAPDDENPLKYKLTDAEIAEVFGLADKLDHFKTPVESGL